MQTRFNRSPALWRKCRHAVLLSVTVGLAACGGSADSGTTTTAQSGGTPIAKAYRQLEQAGKIPVLDRSDDLRGPDKDNNGIRDDIDTYIEKQNYTASQKQAVQQYARHLQESLFAETKSDRAVREAVQRSAGAIHCLATRLPSPQWEESVNVYQKLTLNTKARALASAAVNQAASGMSWSSPMEDSCDS